MAISYFVHREGRTTQTDQVDPAWLRPDSGVVVWADMREPTADDALILKNVFGFHPLSIEDALEASQHPKIESYGSYLYVVLHGIDFKQEEHAFDTLDVDFFLGRNYLVTVHDGKRRSLTEVASLCARNELIMSEGPVAVMHRIVDRMIDHYQPEVEELETWLDDIETQVVKDNRSELTGEILSVKKDIAALRRVVIPQRDVVGRLARREYDFIGQEHAYRFRDVYDQIVRLADEAAVFQDRVTGILDAHLAAVSNQLALISKALTAIAVILGPLTVITGLFGMNVELPTLPGGAQAQFWWIASAMTGISMVIYFVFRRNRWL